ncbi:MAG TPA: hypothetical protein VK961_03425 [Chthoniobacter sp.]|nr:hypothetical protein [Chthoniobacter sp.]
MKKSMSLNEYRRQYPNTAAVPTLSQSGLIGGMLQRHEKRTARQIWRRALISRVVEFPLDVAAWLWRLATAPAAPAAPHPVMVRISRV